MKFTLVSGDITLTWENGLVDDEAIYDWAGNTRVFQYHAEGGAMAPTLDPEDTLGCYMTMREFLGQKTGQPVEPGDEIAEMLDLESRDTGEDE